MNILTVSSRILMIHKIIKCMRHEMSCLLIDMWISCSFCWTLSLLCNLHSYFLKMCFSYVNSGKTDVKYKSTDMLIFWGYENLIWATIIIVLVILTEMSFLTWSRTSFPNVNCLSGLTDLELLGMSCAFGWISKAFHKP